MILDIPGPPNREIRDKIDVQKVWAVVDSSKTQDLAICQAYMEEWGIPLTNIVEINLDLYDTAALDDWWANVGSVVLAALPEDYEAIFCSPNAPLAYVNEASGTSQNGVATSRMLGALQLFKAYIDYTGVYIDWALVLLHLGTLIKYIPDPSATSVDPNDPFTANKLGAPLITGPAAWTKLSGAAISSPPAARTQDSNWFGVSDLSNALDTSRMLQNLDIDGIPAISFYGQDPTNDESRVAGFHAHLAPIDFDLFRIPVLNDGEEVWDVKPSWRLGYAEKGQGVANDRVMTPEDARALARRSQSTSGTIRSRAKLGNAVSYNNAGPSFGNWNMPGFFYWFDHLLRNLGLATPKLGYHYTPSSANFWLWSGNPYNIAEVTGLSRYSTENMNYRYNVNFNNNLQPLNGTTFPIPVGNFFYDGINRNTGYYNNKDTVYQYFEPGTPHQLYNLNGGPVGFSTPSHNLGQGGEFIRAGGVAYYGSYVEPLADTSSNNGTTFFMNLLRGHQAATAGVVVCGGVLSQEEVLGDGLATPFEFEPINYIPTTAAIASFSVTVGAYFPGGVTERYGLTTGSTFAIGSVFPSVITLPTGVEVSLYDCVYYVQSLLAGNIPTVLITLEADPGAVLNTDVSAFNNITIQKNGVNEVTLFRTDATYTTQTNSANTSKELSSWEWEYVPTNPMGTTVGELRDVALRLAGE